MMGMITRLRVSNFRSIEELDLGPGPITILVGPNGSGKSNVIDAIAFVRDAIKNGLDWAVSERQGIDNIRRWSRTRPYDLNIDVTLSLEPSFGFFSFTLASGGDVYSVKREEGHIGKNIPLMISNGDIQIEYLFPELKNKTSERGFYRQHTGIVSSYPDYNRKAKIPIENSDDLVINSMFFSFLEDFRVALSDFEAYSIFPNTLRTAHSLTNDPVLRSRGDNLTSIFKKLRKTNHGKVAVAEITAAMKLIMPSLELIEVRGLGGLLMPQFHVREASEKAHIFNVSQISDGTLRMLGILTALYQHPKPAVIALEEPELTVHPGAIPVIADAIKEASRSSQIIVSTHSTELVDHFEPEQIRAVEMVDGVTRVSPVNAVQVRAVKEKLFTLGELMSSEGLHG